MNGCTLVKAACPNKVISDLVHGGEKKGMLMSLNEVQCMMLKLFFMDVADVE
jgi:hypothetical protein